MRAAALGVLAVGLLLAGCGGPTDPNRAVNVQAIDLAGKAGRCLPASEMGLYAGGSELTGDLRNRLLTEQARGVGVRIFRKDQTVTDYGQQTLYYTNAKADCILWVEGISLQEYAQRLGLNPVGLSPFYEVDKPKPVTPAPTATPTPVPTPTPAAG